MTPTPATTPHPIQRDDVTVRSTDPDTVIGRAFRLLDAFRPGPAELTLNQLASRCDLSRSTAHRLAGQLARQGALEQTDHGWRLGTRIFELGQMVSPQRRLRELALPHMQDLFVATGQTVQLAVEDDNEVLYIEIISGHRKAPSPSRRGGRMPLHCTALGKVLLAFSGDGGRSYLAGDPVLTPRTPSTIIELATLRRELHHVRHEQLAYDHEEAAAGLMCVAAPLLDGEGTAAAAMSVSMPTYGPLTLAAVAPAVRTCARALGRELARAAPIASRA